MRVWLDMANSPHPVLFRSVAADLRDRGHDLLVTTRDHGQTRDLTFEEWPDALVVGAESPGSRLAKGAAIGGRVAGLVRHVRGKRVDVAASLNSYAQITAARALRVPSVTLMDYEYQPANHLGFRLARRVAVPTAFPEERLRTYGASQKRVRRFDGYKEELYLDRPTGAWPRAKENAALAVLRPPAEGALYHRGANEAFDSLLREAASREDVEAIVLPRLAAQRERYAAIDGLTVPEQTLDGLALLRSADVFIGAGGTMSREAAILGVRAYTMFAGELPAVDAALIEAGRLHDLRSLDASAVDWSPRPREADERALSERARVLRSWFADLIEETARR